MSWAKDDTSLFPLSLQSAYLCNSPTNINTLSVPAVRCCEWDKEHRPFGDGLTTLQHWALCTNVKGASFVAMAVQFLKHGPCQRRSGYGSMIEIASVQCSEAIA